jgi:hypothetical protein
VTDAVVLILKGHLLIEEGLFAAIEAKCESGTYLDNARLTFFQKLQIVRALYIEPNAKKDPMIPMLDAVEALNMLRNRLAHNLEPKDVMPLLKKLHVINKDGAVSLTSKTIVSDLNLTLAALTGYIGGLADRTRKGRDDARKTATESSRPKPKKRRS